MPTLSTLSTFCRHLLTATLLVLFATSCIREDDEMIEHIGIGDRLPAFSVVMNDGSIYDSSAPGPSVIVFFHTQCVDCQRELPLLDARYRAGEFEGCRFVCIGRAESADDVAAYWRSAGLALPYSPQPDRRIFDLFATSGIPRIYESNAQGIVTRISRPAE